MYSYVSEGVSQRLQMKSELGQKNRGEKHQISHFFSQKTKELLPLQIGLPIKNVIITVTEWQKEIPTKSTNYFFFSAAFVLFGSAALCKSSNTFL